VAKYGRCNAGFLDLAVTKAQRRDPSQIGFVRFERPPAGHQPGIVGDAIDDRTSLAGLPDRSGAAASRGSPMTE